MNNGTALHHWQGKEGNANGTMGTHGGHARSVFKNKHGKRLRPNFLWEWNTGLIEY